MALAAHESIGLIRLDVPIVEAADGSMSTAACGFLDVRISSDCNMAMIVPPAWCCTGWLDSSGANPDGEPQRQRRIVLIYLDGGAYMLYVSYGALHYLHGVDIH